jgi:hypothetical protein
MLSIIRRRPKTTVVLLMILLLLAYTAFCGLNLAQVRTFRKHPQRSMAIGYFKGGWPHHILARLLVFKRGSKAYNSDLLEWAYHSKLIADDFWNRWILERNIENLPEEERGQILPHYPLTPTDRLVPFIAKALEQNHYEVLPLLGRVDNREAQQLYKSWVENNIVKARNPRLFVAASGSLAQSNVVFLPDLINSFWPQLSSAQKERVTAKIAAHLADEPRIANPLFAWTKANLFENNATMDNGAIALLGRFLAMNSLRDQALEVLAQKGRSIDAARSPLLLHFVHKQDLAPLARPVLEKLKDQNPEAFLEILHYAAHENIATAEALADPYLAGGDSELRKGVIVILVRHGSTKGKGMIEESFSGDAPRKTMYLASSDYGSGNHAAQRYRELSTHDYIEVGKTWPPSYLAKRPSVAEVNGWKQFIAAYPWFPGTDDAYYRLAFSQFAQQDYQGCFSTIREYYKRGYWPDNDVRPFMMRLLRNLILASDVADSEMPFARHLRTIAANPLGPMLLGPRDNIDSTIDSLNWFVANPNYVQFLDTELPTIKLMRDIALEIKASPPDSVCRLIAAKLENTASLLKSTDSPSSLEKEFPTRDDGGEESAGEDQEADEIFYFNKSQRSDEPATYPASIVQTALYALFDSLPSPTPSAVKVSIPTDPGEQAIRQMALFLNSRFAAASLVDVQQHTLDEPVVLALLHTGHDFEKWENEFKPTREFLTAVNTRDIPSIGAARHANLLKENTR